MNGKEQKMTLITLWKDRNQKILDPFLFSKIAEDHAKAIGHEDRSKNKGTQLRSFFDEILRLDAQAQGENADWKLILPRVHMIVAKVAYANGRNLVTDSFVKLMKDGIAQIHEPDDLHVFTQFLEAFMGFYKMYKPN